MPLIHANLAAPLPLLGPGETHIYTFPIVERPEWEMLLSDDEKRRRQRYRFPRARTQYECARVVTRTLLGHYLHSDPASIQIMIADGGKPYIPAAHHLQFNVSHTDGLGVMAVSHQRVGVDIERTRPMPDALDLIQRFFSQDEHAAFCCLPTDQIENLFFRAWTRKEAILKAIGRGVQSLDRCILSIDHEEEVNVLAFDDDHPGHWEMHAWIPAPGYKAAIATEKTNRT